MNNESERTVPYLLTGQDKSLNQNRASHDLMTNGHQCHTGVPTFPATQLQLLMNDATAKTHRFQLYDNKVLKRGIIDEWHLIMSVKCLYVAALLSRPIHGLGWDHHERKNPQS